MSSQALLRDLEALHPRAYGWALVCCDRDRERATDVLQSTYARILDGRARHEGRGELRAFVFGVVRRVARETARRARRDGERWMRLAAERGDEADAPSALARLESEEIAGTLREAVAGLPARQREVLHLVFYQELTLSGAADVLGIGVGSARQHYARGKAALRVHCAPLVRESS